MGLEGGSGKVKRQNTRGSQRGQSTSYEPEWTHHSFVYLRMLTRYFKLQHFKLKKKVYMYMNGHVCQHACVSQKDKDVALTRGWGLL